MKLIYRRTYEEREDGYPEPLGYTLISIDEFKDEQLWCRWWLGIFIYPAFAIHRWYLYTRKRLWRQKRNAPPIGLKERLLAEALTSERDLDTEHIQAIAQYVRNLPPEP